MSDIKKMFPSTVARRLRDLADLFEQGQASALMEQTLRKLFVHEAKASQIELAQLHADLADFEQRYGLSSAEFYRRFQTGQIDDRMDFIEWASVVQMAENARKRLQLLTDLIPA